MHTVLETATFTARAERRLTVEELHATIDAIAKNPAAGDVIKDTGGVRKIRVAVGGRGKSGGARVIYFFSMSSFRSTC
ncbi:type II toxin-antitoxin system RelE/ParE family toxin [Reyranella sp. CPCC 100927]|uniref:type II toxin-antitoxin system RelE/ParE family toxin n=1 Tax=Reyranella sp. CPCC 100927 TaxID=2599616 RepID=UPI002102611D|nr:type II toxin-antitoxin system RelE/ParE family toxin [Reyranella sp. CPCC 100927]